MPIKTEVILLAGGMGRRMGSSTPKAFLLLGGSPVFCHALQVFTTMKEIGGCILVVPSGEEERTRTLCQSIPEAYKVKEVLCGGARRVDSVRCGMDALAQDTDVVLIHDAVRPFCSAALTRRIIQAAVDSGAAVPGIPLADTLKRTDKEGLVTETVDRRNLVAVQTPQGFRHALLTEAYHNAWKHNLVATDDAGLVELLGKPVSVVEGEDQNFKLTKPGDLALAEILFKRKTVKKGRK